MVTDNMNPWLIGGSSRCGKSTFADVIASCSNLGLKIAALRVDALLHKYRNLRMFTSDNDAELFLRTYLQRPRYMNPECTETAMPIDDFNMNVEAVIEEVKPVAGMKPLEIIFRAFNLMAKNNDKESWLVLDLLPELYFESYKKELQDLKLLIILRDPIETVTAGMYWRSYPKRTSICGNKTIEYFLFLWCLSAITSAQLKKKYNDDVFIIYSHELFSEDPVLPNGLEFKVIKNKLKDYYSSVPYFTSKQEGSMHLCPDGTWNNLINEDEIYFIKKYRNIYWDSVINPINIYAKKNNDITKIDILLKVAKFNPILAKLISDNIYMPKQAAINSISRLKELVKRYL